MKKIFGCGIVLFVLSLFFFTFFNGDIFAASALNTIVVTPVNQRLTLKPGEVYEGSFRISNAYESQNNTKYSLSVESFVSQGLNSTGKNSAEVDTTTKTSYNQMMDWITLGTTAGELKPNDVDTINFKINVPTNAPAGGQYATIVITEESGRGSGGNGANIESVMRMAHILYAEVDGKTIKEGEIIENNIPSFLLSGPLKTTAAVKNSGNVHTDAKFILKVESALNGVSFCNNEENPKTTLVLPESSVYHEEECKIPQLGIFKVKQTVAIYDKVSEVEKIVINCPIWLLFVIIVVVIAVVIWILTTIKKKKARRDNETKDI